MALHIPLHICNSLVHNEFKTQSIISYAWTVTGYFSSHTTIKERLRLSCTLIVHQLAHHSKKASALPVLPLRRKKQKQATDVFWSKLGPSFNCSKANAKLQQELPVSGWSSPLCVNGSGIIHSLQQGCSTGSPPGQISRANKSLVLDIPYDLAWVWFGLLRLILSPYEAPFF